MTKIQVITDTCDITVLQQLPKLYLTVEKLGQRADQFVECPAGLFVFDIQHLLLYALQGGSASYKPR